VALVSLSGRGGGLLTMAAAPRFGGEVRFAGRVPGADQCLPYEHCRGRSHPHGAGEHQKGRTPGRQKHKDRVRGPGDPPKNPARGCPVGAQRPFTDMKLGVTGSFRGRATDCGAKQGHTLECCENFGLAQRRGQGAAFFFCFSAALLRGPGGEHGPTNRSVGGLWLLQNAQKHSGNKFGNREQYWGGGGGTKGWARAASHPKRAPKRARAKALAAKQAGQKVFFAKKSSPRGAVGETHRVGRGQCQGPLRCRRRLGFFKFNRRKGGGPAPAKKQVDSKWRETQAVRGQRESFD